jgi:hypothetical protein
MRVADISSNNVTRISVFTTRRTWTSERFWVLSRDYVIFDQMVLALSVARMDRYVQNMVHELIASLYIKFDELPVMYSNLRYENTTDFGCLLFGFEMIPTNHSISKASLLETLSRLTSLFNLNDDLYRSAHLISHGIGPSDQMSG